MLLWLMAEASPMADPSAWMPAISSVTSLGFAIWFSWYTTTKTIPDLLKDHRGEREGIIEEMKQQREAFESALRELANQRRGAV